MLAPGALYLFWTTGVFYVFELAGDYDLILLVHENYRQSEAFQTLIGQHPNLRVLYVPDLRPVRRLHRFYATEVRRLVEESGPRFILSSDIWGMEMLYLFHFGRVRRAQGHPCGCIAIQTSNWLGDFDKDVQGGRALHAAYYVRRYGIPRLLASSLVVGLMHTFLILNTFVYPAVYTGHPLRPWRILAARLTAQRDTVGNFDAFLYYTDAEGDVIRRLFDENCRLHKVVHPLRTHEAAARNLLHAGAEEKSILILPSYTTVLMLQRDLGLTEQAAIEFLAGRWAEIIIRLQARFPSHRVSWKIHPQLVKDPHWQAVTARIRSAVPALEVEDPGEKAETLILQNRVIAGDISTALMWAALLASKIVISFDVFGTKGSDLAGIENIWYFDDLDAFERASFEKPDPGGTVSSSAAGQTPTIREYFAESISGEV